MKRLFHLTLMAIFVLFLNQVAFSQETGIPDTEPVLETDTSSESDTQGSRFYSRDLLTQTLLDGMPDEGTDEGSTVEEDQAAGGDTDTTTGDDQTAGTDTGDDQTSGTDSTTGDDQTAGTDTTTGDDQTAGTDTGGEDTGEQVSGDDSPGEADDEEVPAPADRVAAFVESLTDEQVFALNRSLNNVVKSGLHIEYDMDLLEQIIEGDYDRRQINALTKALEEEAKFQALYEKTGNEKFLERAQSQKEKFLAKIDRFGGPGETEDPFSDDSIEFGLQTGEPFQQRAGIQAMHSTRNSFKETARTSGRAEVRGTAGDASRAAAVESARGAVRQAAKQAVKEATREVAKQAAKDTARQATRESVRETAKQAAKETVREMKKEARQDREKGDKKGKGKG